MWSSVSKFNFPWNNRCYLILVLKFSQFCQRACGIAKPTFEKWRNRAKLFFVTRIEMCRYFRTFLPGFWREFTADEFIPRRKVREEPCALYFHLCSLPVCAWRHSSILFNILPNCSFIFYQKWLLMNVYLNPRWLNVNDVFK